MKDLLLLLLYFHLLRLLLLQLGLHLLRWWAWSYWHNGEKTRCSSHYLFSLFGTTRRWISIAAEDVLFYFIFNYHYPINVSNFPFLFFQHLKFFFGLWVFFFFPDLYPWLLCLLLFLFCFRCWLLSSALVVYIFWNEKKLLNLCIILVMNQEVSIELAK